MPDMSDLVKLPELQHLSYEEKQRVLRQWHSELKGRVPFPAMIGILGLVFGMQAFLWLPRMGPWVFLLAGPLWGLIIVLDIVAFRRNMRARRLLYEYKAREWAARQHPYVPPTSE